MVELLRSGQPVKWDGLGMFQPGIESKKNGVTADDMKATHRWSDPLCARDRVMVVR
jgi:hypothetical protein